METSNTDNWRETTFLANVAKDLMVRFGKDMTNVTVVHLIYIYQNLKS